MTIWLGFLEEFEKESDTLLEDPTVSRIGGRPIWINPKVVPRPENLKCGICEKIMRFLLQIYCPETEGHHMGYHRVIYIFVCEDGTCQRPGFSKSFKVIRIQKENIKDIDTKINQLCVVCNIMALYTCSRCKISKYCSKQHQKVHWELTLHKKYCGTEISKWPLSKRPWWNEMEIVYEAEPEEPKPIGNELIQHKFGPNAIPDKYEKFSSIKGDKTFLRFQKRLSRAPTQVLRYIRTESNNTKNNDILWISLNGQLNSSEIAECPCGEKRTIEFQIMPTLLSFLNIDHSEKYSLDWGILNIYTCEKSCMLANNDVCEELLWRQEISSEIISTI
ncbi:uncharacterized protein T551_03030 [Pneumocystis jirovecii RU7]|uniref:MYND-type domain-containing protein n=1 Tax=Pneumocystis jirovecii (strain RU7) TaxID=1408657 RepID=A0A0W4ZGM8_PNEJ7|nr:uncharacterized protein T551_03030 [Pneumocystis jirovecii RU7]KTW27531.1 hypothetical protein T551_03030 [Pneumocystis jirovecii RU7]